MNSTPQSLKLFPIMDFEDISNFMNYLYPKNSNGIYSYAPSLSNQQKLFFHNLNSQSNKSGSGKLSGRGSGSEPLPDDIHPPKIYKNNKNIKTKNNSTNNEDNNSKTTEVIIELPKNINS